jgi:hypothetical protein
MPINYQLGKIYKITSGDLTYIGSTCEPTLAKRLAKHVSNYKQFQKGNGRSVSSYQLIEKEQYDITLIELCPCGSKDQLSARERFHIENNVCVNKCIPGRTGKERDKTRYEKNKEEITLRHKTYYEANREAIREQQKKAYDAKKVLFEVFYRPSTI